MMTTAVRNLNVFAEAKGLAAEDKLENQVRLFEATNLLHPDTSSDKMLSVECNKAKLEDSYNRF